MAHALCIHCGKPLAETAKTCPHCGRSPQPAGANPPAQSAPRRTAMDREFELLCLMDDIF